MAIKEQATNQDVFLVLNESIVSDTDTDGAILDTADYDNGVYFAMGIVGFDSTNTQATLTIYEGDDASMSDATLVPASKLVYSDAATLEALTSEGSKLIKQACHSTKRYLRVRVTTVGLDTSVHVVVVAVANPEVLPTLQS